MTEAVQAARETLLGPVPDGADYDDEVTRRYSEASAVVNHWPGLSHRQRIQLNTSLPWEQAVRFVWREVSLRRAG